MTDTAHPALPAIEEAVRQAIGGSFRATACTATGGGCISETFTIADGRQRYFVKLGAAGDAAMFAAEAEGLAAIAASGSFRTPAVIAQGGDGAHAFLVLEHLELRPLATAAEGIAFAERLVQLHRTPGEHFGWRPDNFIGRSPQPNGEGDNWAAFFVARRLRPQFERARANGFGGDLQRQGERLLGRVPALFLDYRPQPSLLHGDLWHGNAAFTAAGEPTVFDPAVHFGDREADLAMSELFGGFPSAFYAAYRSAWPLNEDYEQRKPLYSLYHILNHLNLFGRSYLREALRLSTRLNEELSLRRD